MTNNNINFKSLTDEQLTALYQNGNELAFNELYRRYIKFLESKATKDHYRNPEIDSEEFVSSHIMKFHKAVKTFDATSVIYFAHWIKIKLSKSTFDVVRSHKNTIYKNKDGEVVIKDKKRLKTVSYDALTEYNEDSNSYDIADERTTHEAMQPIEHTELFQYIRSKNEEDAKVAIMRVQGYSFEEISKSLGKYKSWVNRSLKRLQEYAVEFEKLSNE